MLDGLVSSVNSSQAALGNGEIFEGVFEDVSNFDSVTVSVYADGAGASNGLQFIWSTDGQFDEIIAQETFELDLCPDGVTQSGRAYSLPIQGRYFRVRYVNLFAQTFFRLQSIYRFVASDEYRKRINDTLNPSDVAAGVRAALFAQPSQGVVGTALEPIEAHLLSQTLDDTTGSTAGAGLLTTAALFGKIEGTTLWKGVRLDADKHLIVVGSPVASGTPVNVTGSVTLSALPIGVSGTVLVQGPVGVSGSVALSAQPIGVSGTVTALIAGPLAVSGTVAITSGSAVYMAQANAAPPWYAEGAPIALRADLAGSAYTRDDAIRRLLEALLLKEWAPSEEVVLRLKERTRVSALGLQPYGIEHGLTTERLANVHGIPFHIGGHPNTLAVRANFTAAATNVALLSPSGGLKIVVTRVMAALDKAGSANVSVLIGFGASSTPAGAQVIAAHPGIDPGGGFTTGDGSGMLGTGALGDSLFITSSVPTGGSLDVTVTYHTIDS